MAAIPKNYESFSFKKLNVLLSRQKDAHKGQNGRILVIGGSVDLVGAPILTSVAALRSGADIVTCCCPFIVGQALNAYCPDIMTLKVRGNYFTLAHISVIIDVVQNYDVLVIGNGIGMHTETRKFIRKLLAHPVIHEKKKIIDADALKMISLAEVSNAILTPHAREYTLLLQNSGINENTSLKELQQYLYSNIILKKGATDTIISSSIIAYNKTGNPGLAKAGTGDVLAGICAAVYAKTGEQFLSAKVSAWLVGIMGDILFSKKKGYYFIASDLLSELKRMNLSD